MNSKLLFLILLLNVSLTSLFAQGKVNDRVARWRVEGCSFTDFLSKAIKYPVCAQENNLQGQVIIDFVVDRNGKLKDFISVKQFDKECVDYAIQALRTSPEWLPEIKNGRFVDSKQSVTIYFKLIGADTKMDVEPKDNDIIVWGYGMTKN